MQKFQFREVQLRATVNFYNNIIHQVSIPQGAIKRIFDIGVLANDVESQLRKVQLRVIKKDGVQIGLMSFNSVRFN